MILRKREVCNPMRIAVYSGSFNPLHIGHLAIIRHLTHQGGYDMVYLIVSPKNPLKPSAHPESAQDRFRAAVAAVNSYPDLKVKVDDIELNMPAPHYTIKTLDALAAREPQNDFTLVVGADNLANFSSWRDWERILTDYSLAVFPRDNMDRQRSIQKLSTLLGDRSALLDRITLINAPLVNVSSTQIRQAQQSGKQVEDLLM